MQESLESRNNPNENGVESYDDEKTLVMMNVLKTIEQLVSSAKDKKELVTEMEKGILPLLEATIRNQVVGELACSLPPSSSPIERVASSIPRALSSAGRSVR